MIRNDGVAAGDPAKSNRLKVLEFKESALCNELFNGRVLKRGLECDFDVSF